MKMMCVSLDMMNKLKMFTLSRRASRVRGNREEASLLMLSSLDLKASSCAVEERESGTPRYVKESTTMD